MLTGEIWAEKWESWSFVHTTVLPQLISSQMQSSDWLSPYVHNFFDQWEIRIWNQIRRVCTQPENHNCNQGQFWKMGCLSFFQYRTIGQSKVTLLSKPKVDILVKMAFLQNKFCKVSFQNKQLVKNGTLILYNHPTFSWFSTTSLLISWKFPGNPDFTA